MSDLLEKIISIIKGDNGKQPQESDLSKNKELAEQLKTMEEEYNNAHKLEEPDYDQLFPKESGLYKKEYEPTSEEQLLKEAEASLDTTYQKNIDDLTTSNEYKMEKLNQKQQEAEVDLVEDVDKLMSQTQEQKQDLTHSMINRGTVYSSIYDEGKKDILMGAESGLQKINADYDLTLNEIRYEMDHLNLTYQNSLQYYELKYAEDLEKKLSDLKLKEEKRLEEINKYNLNIMKEEEAYQKKRLEQIEEERQKYQRASELAAQAEKISEAINGMSPEKKAEMEKRYELAYNFYSQYDRATAMKLLNENYNTLVETLGIDLFNKLYLSL